MSRSSSSPSAQPDPVEPAAQVPFTFRLGGDFTDEPEMEVGLPPTDVPVALKPLPVSSIDLAGKAKVWFVIGAGNRGKTTYMRWLCEMSANAGSYPIMAAVDPGKRSLANFFANVALPPTNDPAAVARWLEALLEHVMVQQVSACIDFGGGDTSLQKLLRSVPDLVASLKDAGVEPVVLHAIGPRTDDLSPLATFEKLGFQPPATALMCNEGLVDAGIGRDEAFARVKRHSAYKAAVARGAAEIWMPGLDPVVAQELEGKHLGFMLARDAKSPEGRAVAPLAPFKRSKVRTFLTRMQYENAPIASWRP